jgi:hypothetical protein
MLIYIFKFCLALIHLPPPYVYDRLENHLLGFPNGNQSRYTATHDPFGRQPW